jgi:hypothetical protein
MPSFLDRFRRPRAEEPPGPPEEPEPIAEPESPEQPQPEPELEPVPEPESAAPRPHHVSKPPRRSSAEERGVGPGTG